MNSYRNIVLLIGNGINNIKHENETSWANLIKNLNISVGKPEDANDLVKQFPLVFENLLNFGLNNGHITNELDLKTIVAEWVSHIVPNNIHLLIHELPVEHIITTNYDFVLEDGLRVSNESIISESKYSIFRRYVDKIENKTIWHIHGDIKTPQSINLGFEHYSGQLQHLRNYVVSGSNYKAKDYDNSSLISKFKKLKSSSESWVDLFFTKDIHIIGLSLDFIEIDLWWLLTYRAKLRHNSQKIIIENRIFYYIPEKYRHTSLGKIELLQNIGITVISIPLEGEKYYQEVLKQIERYVIGEKFYVRELQSS